ncbi:hypothetical protein [Flavobacterium olei]|uniref:hypothetical protein n=1 Tax=Flavobacterium olei TaxID=1886782 RepID=UPI00321A89C3
METNLNSIHIFKTNIKQIAPNCVIDQTLTNHLDIQQWSIDLEDVDCVLRVVSEKLTPREIMNLINQNGYECQELS